MCEGNGGSQTSKHKLTYKKKQRNRTEEKGRSNL
jgi:hypothetical protein